MKSAVIFAFSGTGNTALVADMIRDRLVRLGLRVDVVRIEDVLKGLVSVDAGQYDLVGVGSQVIGFTAPSPVTRFARSLPRVRGKKAFVFMTAGGVAPINYNAPKPIVRALRRRGYDAFHERIFSIGSNWINRFDDDVVARLYGATKRKAGLMADELIQLKPRVLKTGFGQRLAFGALAAVVPAFVRTVGKDYRVGASCTRCGLCVRNCPTGNIVESKSGIRFKFSCVSCLRCLYSCPTGALSLRKFASFAVPGGYDIRKILGDSGATVAVAAGSPAGRMPTVSPASPARPEPPFLERYLADDAL